MSSMVGTMQHNQRLVYAPYGRSDSRRDAAPAAQAWRYV
jgi:hypothetical protein